MRWNGKTDMTPALGNMFNFILEKYWPLQASSAASREGECCNAYATHQTDTARIRCIAALETSVEVTGVLFDYANRRQPKWPFGLVFRRGVAWGLQLTEMALISISCLLLVIYRLIWLDEDRAEGEAGEWGGQVIHLFLINLPLWFWRYNFKREFHCHVMLKFLFTKTVWLLSLLSCTRGVACQCKK